MRLMMSAVLALVASSASAQASVSPEDIANVRKAIKIRQDKFEPLPLLQAPRRMGDHQNGSAEWWVIGLLADPPKLTVRVKSMYNTRYTGGTVRYDRALGVGGTPLEIVDQSRDIGECSGLGCDWVTNVMVDLPPEALKADATEPFELKISGERRATVIVSISPAYQRALFEAIEAHRKVSAP